MSRPTMDRAIEAIEAGDFERAWSCARAMKHEWRFLHDLMAESMLGLVTYIQETLGEEHVGRGLEASHGARLEARHRARSSSATGARSWRRWRPPGGRTPTSGTGPEPGRLHDRGGRREVHLPDEPLRLAASGSGATARYEGEDAYGVTRGGARLVLRPRGLPALLHALRVHERAAADPWYGAAALPVATRPRTSTTIPAPGTGTRTRRTSRTRHWERYGLEQGAAGLSAPGCALVTGAARGIGRAIAVRLAADGLGGGGLRPGRRPCPRPTAGSRSRSTSPMRTPWPGALPIGRVRARPGGGRGRERRDRRHIAPAERLSPESVAARAGREPDRRLPHRAAGHRRDAPAALGPDRGDLLGGRHRRTRGQVVLLGRARRGCSGWCARWRWSWRRSR